MHRVRPSKHNISIFFQLISFLYLIFLLIMYIFKLIYEYFVLARASSTERRRHGARRGARRAEFCQTILKCQFSMGYFFVYTKTEIALFNAKLRQFVRELLTALNCQFQTVNDFFSQQRKTKKNSI